tara:strand:- start:225 stop:500 length:276 start_codon:yes stop_codon:yes gene_type:complete
MKTYKQFMEQIVPKDFSPPPFRYMPHIRTPAIKDMEMKHYNNYIKSSGIDYAKKPKKFGKDPKVPTKSITDPNVIDKNLDAPGNPIKKKLA